MLATTSSIQSNTQNLADYLATQQAKVNSGLEAWFAKNENPKEILIQSLSYSLFLPSKRIRPLYALEVCRAFCGEELRALPAAMSLEMIHTYSLIHDDLPAMDNDDLRRGKPTNHKVYGDAVAILAGDGLLTLAFEVLANASSEVTSQTRLDWISELSRAAGVRGMVLGQEWDISQREKVSKERLQSLHLKKTGALLGAATAMGAIAAGASPKKITQARDFGLAMGLAFQIRDDILDVTGGAEIGKPVRSDERNDKTTYVSLMGLNEAQREGERWYCEALRLLEGLELTYENRLEELTKYVIERKV